MTTEHQIQANGANAKRSAGPITEAGQQALHNGRHRKASASFVTTFEGSANWGEGCSKKS
jgi:hypothetical protein